MAAESADSSGAGASAEARLTALAERARRARMRRAEREYPSLEQVTPPLEELVQRYLATESDPAGAAAREKLRVFVRGVHDVQAWLLWSAGEWRRAFESSRDASKLVLALAALSLEDQRTDARDTLLAVGLVWHRAVRAGVDPRPLLERVAALSASGEQGLASVLRGFEQSAFFAEDVRPHLDSAELAFETE